MPDLTREQRDAYITSVLSSYHRVEEGHPAPCPECEDIVGMVLMIEAEARAEQAAEVERLRRIIAAARFVGGYWVDAILASESLRGTGMSHPVACVNAALDGVDDPSELGISEARWADFRAALAATPEPRP